MTLKFIVSKAGYDGNQEIATALKTDMMEKPNDRFFYLVPNHMKFESEIDTLAKVGNGGDVTAESNLQVLSFSRLAWYFLRGTAEYQRQRISPAGINMLLYQVINDSKDDLFLFDQEVNHAGFLDQLSRQITEFQSGNVTPSDLFSITKSDADLTNDLQDKLHDFGIIYDRFQTEIESRYFDNHNGLNLLSDYLDSHEIKGTHFFISNFSKLTAQELRLVETLIVKGDSVTVGLTLDRAYPTDLPNSDSLFYAPAKLFHRLYQFAAANQVPYLGTTVADNPRVNSDLLRLEQYWQQSSSMEQITAPNKIQDDSVQIIKTDSRYTELDQVATKIRQLVATKGYRYSDFLIVTRKLAAYQNVLQPVFENAEIPYFEDIQKSMADHPLVELLDALFSMVDPNRRRNYMYDDVMRFLKSELVLPKTDDGYLEIDEFRQDLALAENLVLKNGFEDQKWLQSDDWQYVWVQDGDEEVLKTERNERLSARVNVVRHLIKDNLPRFYKRLFKASTNTEAATIIYNFLTDMGVFDQLVAWRDRANNAGDINRADQIEQVHKTFVNLLDEMVSILGDRQFVADDFWNLLYSGFVGATYSLVPTTLDQVSVSESGMVQMNNRKITFIIGATDDNMPMVSVNESLFGDDDVNQLETVLPDEKYLNDPSDAQIAFEPYLNYLSFLSGSEKLIFTYSEGEGEENAIKLSPYVARIANYFHIKPEEVSSVPANSDDVDKYIGTLRSSLHHLIQVSQASAKANESLAPSWQYTLNKIKSDGRYTFLVDRLLASLDYKNEVHSLDKEIVTDLYNGELNISISQLESFYQNPYEYFLRYGLKLQERDEFKLSPQSTGQFFHEALERIVDNFRQNKIELSELGDDEIKKLVSDTVSTMVTNPDNFAYVILQSSNRMKYITNELQKTLIQMVTVLKEQQTRTPMRPKQTELVFGQPGGSNLAGLEFELPDNNKIHVRGRIDRIDELDIPEKKYFAVVDYKSSERDFDFSKAYSGLSMQLMTYLDVVKKNLDKLSDSDEKALLAGVLYLHIKNSIVKPEELAKDKIKGDINNFLLDDHRYNGLLVEDMDLLKHVDTSHDKDNPLYLPFALKKDGTPTAKSSLITPEDLDRFLNHTENLIVEAGTQIFNGDIKLAPFKDGKATALQFSPYKSIMNFDPLLPENRYNVIEKLKAEEVIARLKEEHKE
ncbi:PD-(D/E)XK nuclease family protein [Lentilactobacillus sp. Marseille-Q4993]|uniref:PD-(D/E)XK nuclease family protein n=1 Tax=Lentilactobacillus sp. Marseille-Q4993 TaxID=3039492 RepID=UPI0024BCEB97|nr:PD-(D/E)XK nuclease family protein [Lentilactobacillus sp. Marseille-Q4993]